MQSQIDIIQVPGYRFEWCYHVHQLLLLFIFLCPRAPIAFVRFSYFCRLASLGPKISSCEPQKQKFESTVGLTMTSVSSTASTNFVVGWPLWVVKWIHTNRKSKRSQVVVAMSAVCSTAERGQAGLKWASASVRSQHHPIWHPNIHTILLLDIPI